MTTKVKHLVISVLLISWPFIPLFSQSDSIPKGKPVIQIFGYVDYKLKQPFNNLSFGINRAHIGYQYNFNHSFLGKIVLDAGRPTQVGIVSKNDSLSMTDILEVKVREGSYYSMTLKFAFLEWKYNEHFKLQVGSILQNHYITQEKFWGYRYVAKTFQDEFYNIPSGDLGLIGYLNIGSMVSLDAAVTNGEGFRKNQDFNGSLKYAAGITINPNDYIVTRLYYSLNQPPDTLLNGDRQLLSYFLGIRPVKNFRIGGEYNYMFNDLNIKGYDVYGFSVYSVYCFYPGLEILLRYDQVYNQGNDDRLITEGLRNDGKFIIAGLGYDPLKNVRLSLNFHSWIDSNKDNRAENMLSFCFEFYL